MERLTLTFSVGIIERIRYKNKDYKRPEPLNSAKKKNLSVVMSVYKLKSPIENAGLHDLVYSTDERTIRTLSFYDLLCEVMLQTNDTPNQLTLSVSESACLQALIKKRFTKNKVIRNSTSSEDF